MIDVSSISKATTQRILALILMAPQGYLILSVLWQRIFNNLVMFKEFVVFALFCTGLWTFLETIVPSIK